MAELEIHHEEHGEHDPVGQRVGVLAALLAVALAVVTIVAHRTHTAAIIHKASANDDWSHYQAVRVKFHNIELGEQMVKLVGGKTDEAEKVLADYAKQSIKYDAQSKEVQAQAQEADEASEADEHKALRYDVGEGLLEIGLVMSSLYFISKKRMFPVMGLLAGLIGIGLAISGALM